MKSQAIVLSLISVLPLTSCGESKAPATPSSEATPPSEPSLIKKARELARKGIASVEALDWTALQSRITAEGLSIAKQALDGVDLAAAKARYDELAAALAANDYVKASFYAQKLDALLSSELVSKSVEFLKVESEAGADAARKAVEEYLLTPNLSENARLFGKQMLSYFQSIKADRGDMEKVLFWATYYVVRSSLPGPDSHLQNALAGIAASAIPRGFHAYDLHTKEGVELSEAILRSWGTDKKGAEDFWNGLVRAGKKGVGELQKALGTEPAPAEAQK